MRKVDVICPGFVADCLETLEEIDIEARAAFLEAGGTDFNYIACLNESPLWIGALADLAQRQNGRAGRSPGCPEDLQQRREAALAQRESMARERGAAA